jgi:ABC-2 type transport system permease protein
MNATIALSTTGRVLRQLKADPRTIAMILLIPLILMTLIYFMFENQVGRPGGPEPFDRIALVLLEVLPFAIMFSITSIAMLPVVVIPSCSCVESSSRAPICRDGSR